MFDATTTAALGIDFEVETRPIYTAEGKAIPEEIVRGVYRTDTDDVIATCGPSFKPVQHHAVVQPLLDRLSDRGYDVEIRAADQKNLYDLQGKKGCFVSSTLDRDGARMRTSIITGDFITPTGNSAFLAHGDDTNFFRIDVINSHDGCWSVRATTSYLRLICMNGMVRPKFTAGAYGKHTANFSLDAMDKKIQLQQMAMDEDADMFGLYARTPITGDQAAEFIGRTLAKMPTKPGQKAEHSERLVKKILGHFSREDQTVWGLYNAMTHWSTHDNIRGGESLTGRVGREQRVGAAVARFNDLVAA